MARARRRLSPLLELTRARILEFAREPEAIFWVFVFPVLLAGGLGIAFRDRPADKPRVGVHSTLQQSEPVLFAALVAAPELQAESLEPAAAAKQLRGGKIDLVVRRPPLHDSAGDAEARRLPAQAVEGGAALPPAPRAALRYDATRPEGRVARLAVADVIQKALGRRDVATTVDEPVTQPGSRYIDFLVPGLIGLNIMGSTLWSMGFAVVLTRKRRLLRSYAATPMRRSHFLLSFWLSRMVFLVLEVGALLLFASLVFDVTVRGSWLAVALVAVLASACFGGLSLLVGARTESIEAASGWMNVVQMPMWVLSGSFFSYERFPEALLPAVRALPLTATNDTLRSLMNEGTALVDHLPALLVLLVWGLVSFLLALRFFRWR